MLRFIFRDKWQNAQSETEKKHEVKTTHMYKLHTTQRELLSLCYA